MSARKGSKCTCTFPYCPLLRVIVALRPGLCRGEEVRVGTWVLYSDWEQNKSHHASYSWSQHICELLVIQTWAVLVIFVPLLEDICYLFIMMTADHKVISIQRETHTFEAFCQFLWRPGLNFALFHRKSKICYGGQLHFPAMTVTASNEILRMCHCAHRVGADCCQSIWMPGSPMGN